MKVQLLGVKNVNFVNNNGETISGKVSASEAGEVSDEAAAVSTEGTVLDGSSIDIVSSGITVSTGSVAEPAGKNVDVKV